MTESRPSDSPHILGVTRREYKGDTDVTVPDCCWDILVIKYKGQTEVVLTGTITHPILLNFPPGTEVMNITFQPNTFLTDFSARRILNQGVSLPSAGKNKVRLGNDIIEIPDFENAEAFVQKLQQIDALKSDKVVDIILSGNQFAASERSLQRHFMETTGLTMKFVQQVQRAQIAVDLLKQGKRIADVAHTLGFTDQAHMTKSLKGIMGVTPAIVQEKAELSKCSHCGRDLADHPSPVDGIGKSYGLHCRFFTKHS